MAYRPGVPLILDLHVQPPRCYTSGDLQTLCITRNKSYMFEHIVGNLYQTFVTALLLSRKFECSRI